MTVEGALSIVMATWVITFVVCRTVLNLTESDSGFIAGLFVLIASGLMLALT